MLDGGPDRVGLVIVVALLLGASATASAQEPVEILRRAEAAAYDPKNHGLRELSGRYVARASYPLDWETASICDTFASGTFAWRAPTDVQLTYNEPTAHTAAVRAILDHVTDFVAQAKQAPAWTRILDGASLTAKGRKVVIAPAGDNGLEAFARLIGYGAVKSASIEFDAAGIVKRIEAVAGWPALEMPWEKTVATYVWKKTAGRQLLQRLQEPGLGNRPVIHEFAYRAVGEFHVPTRQIRRFLPANPAMTVTIAVELHDVKANVGLPKGTFTDAMVSGPQSVTPLAAGSSVPDVAIAGRTKNKAALIAFVTDWSAPSQRAMAALARTRSAFSGVDVIAVRCREKPYGALSRKKPKPIRAGRGVAIVEGGDAIADAFQVNTLPHFFVVDADGKVMRAFAGFGDETEPGLTEALRAVSAR